MVKGVPSMETVLPSTPSSAPKRRSHAPWVRTAVAGASGSSSAVPRSLPRAARAPMSWKKSPDTPAPVSSSGVSPVCTVRSWILDAATDSKAATPLRQAANSAGATDPRPSQSEKVVPTWTSRSASGYGSGRSTMPSAMLKIVVAPAIPTARVPTAVSVYAGLRASERSAPRRSRIVIPIPPPPCRLVRPSAHDSHCRGTEVPRSATIHAARRSRPPPPW